LIEEEKSYNINIKEMKDHFDTLRHQRQGNIDSNIQNEHTKQKRRNKLETEESNYTN